MTVTIRAIAVFLFLVAMFVGCSNGSIFPSPTGPSPDQSVSGKVQQICLETKTATGTVTATQNCDKSQKDDHSQSAPPA
jgi:hypothetical protein